MGLIKVRTDKRSGFGKSRSNVTDFQLEFIDGSKFTVLPEAQRTES